MGEAVLLCSTCVRSRSSSSSGESAVSSMHALQTLACSKSFAPHLRQVLVITALIGGVVWWPHYLLHEIRSQVTSAKSRSDVATRPRCRQAPRLCARSLPAIIRDNGGENDDKPA